MKIIHIEWDGPYTIGQLPELKNEVSDYGVYQVYGAHPVYGSNVLLYIGKADEQTFGVRLKQEDWIYNQDSQRVKFYVGRLAGASTPDDITWSKEIDLGEKLLIYTHSPALNTKNLNSIPDKELRNVHVLNWGLYRDLLPEVSGERWTWKHWEIAKYKVYGKESE